MRGGVRFSGRPRPTWFPIGGGVEAGEDVAAAARREVAEETGLTDVVLGPAVWVGEGVFQMRTEPVLFHETFVLARTRATQLSREGWDDSERQSVADLRWWRQVEMQGATDEFYPARLRFALSGLATRAGGQPERIRLI